MSRNVSIEYNEMRVDLNNYYGYYVVIKFCVFKLYGVY